MIQTIVFDFGKVIAHFDHFQTLAKLAPFTDRTPQQMFESVYNGPLEDAVESGRISVDEFLQTFIASNGLRCDATYLGRAVADIFAPNPEVCSLIPRLRPRYRLILGSNTQGLHADHFRVQFAETFAHFDALVFSHEIGCRKPSPRFFEHCLKLTACLPQQCVFIDDLKANVEGARAAGFHGIVYQPNADLAGQLRKLGVEI